MPRGACRLKAYFPQVSQGLNVHRFIIKKIGLVRFLWDLKGFYKVWFIGFVVLGFGLQGLVPGVLGFTGLRVVWVPTIIRAHVLGHCAKQS